LKLPSIKATDTLIQDTQTPNAHLALLGSEGNSAEIISALEQTWLPTGNDILIIEDNTELRDRMEAQLQSQGFSCYSTATAEDALTHLHNRSHSPTLIVADWMLPGMTGLEFIKALRNNDAQTDLPVFIVSARADQQSRNEALIAGAVSYMAKPFGMQDFLARVQALVGRRQSLSELNREAKSVLIGNLATYLSDAFINPLTSVRQTLSLLVHDPSISLDRQHHQMLFQDELAAIDRLASFLQTLSRMTESLAITTFFDPCETIENSLTSLPQDRWDFIATPLADDEDLVWQGTTALLSFGVTELLLWWIEPQFEAGQRIGISLEKLGPNQLCLKLSGSRREGLGARSEQGLKMVEDLWALSHWSVQALEDDAHIKVLLTANKAKTYQEKPFDNPALNQEQATTESEPSPIG
jgi:DNA-binding response OmpR family regulator